MNSSYPLNQPSYAYIAPLTISPHQNDTKSVTKQFKQPNCHPTIPSPSTNPQQTLLLLPTQMLAPIPTNPPRPKNLTAGELPPPPPAAMDSAGSPPPPSKRLVMVIADPSRESSVALQWALSHAVLEQDDLVLLHVEPANPGRRAGTLSALLRRPAGNAGSQQQPALSPTSSSSSSSAGSGEGGEWEFLEAMRAACEAAQPKVRVRVQVERGEVEGREKAAKILSQTKLLGVDLLVIGQRRSGSSFLG